MPEEKKPDQNPAERGNPYGTYPHSTTMTKDKNSFHGKESDRGRIKRDFDLNRPLNKN